LTRTRARAALTFSLLDELPEELIALSVAEALVRSDRPEGAVRLSRCSRRLRRLLSDACREAQNRSVIWTLSGLHLSQPIELKESERVKFDDDSRVATIKVRIRGDPYNWHELHGALVSHVALPPPHTPVGAIVMSWTVSVDFPTDKESHPGFYRIGCFDDSDHSRWWCFNGFSGRLDSQNGFGPNLVNGLEDSRPNVQEDAHTTIELILSASAAHGLQANRLWFRINGGQPHPKDGIDVGDAWRVRPMARRVISRERLTASPRRLLSETQIERFAAELRSPPVKRSS